MKYLRAILPLVLTLVLAACGGTGPVTPTPTPDPAPPNTEPTEPVDPPTGQPDTPPDVAYYGEWGWDFQGQEDYESSEGRFSIIDVAPDNATESYGLYQICYDRCYDLPDGYAYIGVGEGDTLNVELYRLNSANDLEMTYTATDEDGELTEDDQGRLVFEGSGTEFNEFTGEVSGTFTAVFIAAEPALFFAE